MSKVDNLKFVGQVVAEAEALVAGIVANGKNYLADLVYLPKIVAFGEDAASAAQNLQADMAEIEGMDEAGRAEVAASWQAAMKFPSNASVETILQEGCVIASYVLEAVGYFLRTQQAPKPAA